MAMERKVTLKDIAKALNISIGTVERALHGRKGINPDTKKMVLEKVKELDYRSNIFARSLSLKTMKTVAVVMPGNSGFWRSIREGLEHAEKEMAVYGIKVRYICLNKMDINVVTSYLKDLLNEGVSGVILAPEGIQVINDRLNEVINSGLSVMLLNDDIPNSKRLLYVGPDNKLIGRLAGELTGKFAGGAGRCLVISCNNIQSENLPVECEERIANFEEVLKSEFPGMKTDIAIYRLYRENAYDTVKECLERDSSIKCIYSADGYINEVAMAVKDFGRKNTVLVGHEMSDEVNVRLKEGIISAVICQNPFLQGYFSLKCMIEYLINGKIPRGGKMYINFNIYTKYNSYERDDYAGDFMNNT